MKKFLEKLRENIIFIIIIVFIFLPILAKIGAGGHSLDNVLIIVSDTSPEAFDAEYIVSFNTNIDLSAGERINITFPNNYSSPIAGLADVLCPNNMTASISGRTVICTVNLGQIHFAGATEIIIGNVLNPEKIQPEGIADIHMIDIFTDQGETARAMITITEPLVIRGRIEPILTFEVEGVGIGESVHGNLTSATTTAFSIAFGDLPVNTPVLVAQDLFVRTNAGYGFTVSVVQEREPEAEVHGRTHKIYCFINGNCRDFSEATPWVSPEGILGAPETYGHFGVTSENNSLDINCDQNYYGFGEGGRWAGMEVAFPIEVMRHCGPSDGLVQHEGWTRVGFQTEITMLQPAGEYETIFTYVITPTF